MICESSAQAPVWMGYILGLFLLAATFLITMMGIDIGRDIIRKWRGKPRTW